MTRKLPKQSTITRQQSALLLSDVRVLIEEARQTAARRVNSALVMLYWQVGKRIREDVLKQKRAEYGKQVLPALSAKLGWSHFRQLDANTPGGEA